MYKMIDGYRGPLSRQTWLRAAYLADQCGLDWGCWAARPGVWLLDNVSDSDPPRPTPVSFTEAAHAYLEDCKLHKRVPGDYPKDDGIPHASPARPGWCRTGTDPIGWEFPGRITEAGFRYPWLPDDVTLGTAFGWIAVLKDGDVRTEFQRMPPDNFIALSDMLRAVVEADAQLKKEQEAKQR